MVMVPVQGPSPYFAYFDATNAINLAPHSHQRLIRKVYTYIKMLQGSGWRRSSMERLNGVLCSDGPCAGTITAFLWKSRVIVLQLLWNAQ